MPSSGTLFETVAEVMVALMRTLLLTFARVSCGSVAFYARSTTFVLVLPNLFRTESAP